MQNSIFKAAKEKVDDQLSLLAPFLDSTIVPPQNSEQHKLAKQIERFNIRLYYYRPNEDRNSFTGLPTVGLSAQELGLIFMDSTLSAKELAAAIKHELAHFAKETETYKELHKQVKHKVLSSTIKEYCNRYGIGQFKAYHEITADAFAGRIPEFSKEANSYWEMLLLDLNEMRDDIEMPKIVRGDIVGEVLQVAPSVGKKPSPLKRAIIQKAVKLCDNIKAKELVE